MNESYDKAIAATAYNIIIQKFWGVFGKGQIKQGVYS